MSKKDKISDLPSYSKLKNDIQGMDAIGKVVKFLSTFGIKNKELSKEFSKLPELKKQVEYLSSLPDKFNSHFAKSGWIAHESMNSPLMEKAVSFAENGKNDKAEHLLADHFTSNRMEWLLRRFTVLPEFSIRYNLIEKAYQNTLEKRYYSCVPLLLLLIDGIVNDISRSKGFFSDNTDLTAWDSVASHSSGLTAIRDIFNEPREKTNTKEIFLPYRNGILHGRDIKYDNKFVASKCWSTLFAINDWARALKKEKKNPPLPKKQLSIKESIKELKTTIIEHQEWKVRHDQLLRKLDEWKPRDRKIISLDPSTFKDFSPEKEAHDFGINWLNKNYGKIALQVYQFGDKDLNISKEAGRVRSELGTKELKEFKITSIKDESPDISEITLGVTCYLNSEEMKKEIILRMICKSESGETGINGEENVIWKFIDNFFYDLDH